MKKDNNSKTTINISKAFKGIENGELTISEAANFVGMEYREFYSRLLENNIKINYSKEKIKESSKRLFEKTKK